MFKVNFKSNRNLLKWRLKLKEDLKKTKSIKAPIETSLTNVDDLLNEINGTNAQETELTNTLPNVAPDQEEEDDDLDNELKDALFTEKKQEKK